MPRPMTIRNMRDGERSIFSFQRNLATMAAAEDFSIGRLKAGKGGETGMVTMSGGGIEAAFTVKLREGGRPGRILGVDVMEVAGDAAWQTAARVQTAFAKVRRALNEINDAAAAAGGADFAGRDGQTISDALGGRAVRQIGSRAPLEEHMGGDGADVLTGRGGSDLFIGTPDRDRIDGGPGMDAVSYKFYGFRQGLFTGDEGVSVNLRTGAAMLPTGELQRLKSIESVHGTDGDDRLRGDDESNTLFGFAGDDLLSGRAGDDFIFGGPGNDDISGGLDDDQLSGGDGADTVDGQSGDDQLFGGAGDDLLSGGGGDDRADGGDGQDTVFGGEGDDELAGGAGDDLLYGEDGADTLTGGEGDDLLSGDFGRDRLDGGPGDDALSPGPGADEIVADLTGGTDTLFGFGPRDTILVGGGHAFEDLTFTQMGDDVALDIDGVGRVLIFRDAMVDEVNDPASYDFF